jgi:hypothetical protein
MDDVVGIQHAEEVSMEEERDDYRMVSMREENSRRHI